MKKNAEKKIILIFSAVVFLTTCGIDEYYYLPQVSQGDIRAIGITSADINIPPINHLDYATGYRIFYRIYTSNSDRLTGNSISTPSERSGINSALNNDYNNLDRIADPTSNTVTSASTFRDYRYYELEIETGNINLILTKYGGTLSIQFGNTPGDSPVLFYGGTSYALYRTNGGGTFTLEPNRFFFRSSDLENVTTMINGDVSRSGSGHAYVSMYIVAAGINRENFSNIYSKPTHINIFKLPNEN